MTDERNTPATDEPIEDLDVAASDAEEVKGGRKSGEGQKDFLKVELKEIVITS